MKNMTKAEYRAYIKSVGADAPNVAGKTLTTTELVAVYNYMAMMQVEDATFRQYVIDYATSQKWSKARLRQIAKIKEYNFRTLGSNCWVLANGGMLPEDVLERHNAKLDALLAAVTDAPTVQETVVAKTTEKPNIQERITEKVQDLIGDIEVEIDAFWSTETISFKTSAWLSNNNVKPMLAAKIADHYRPFYDEAMQILAGDDDQLNEAYAHVKKSVKKRYAEFIKSIVNDCDVRANLAKAMRKPRKKKVKTPIQLVSKLKYLPESKEYKLTSEDPTKIIGASQVWVFNTKYRDLGVFHAMAASGITVQGSTLKGIDTHKSVAKKLRKPNETLPRVLKGGKVVLRRVLGEIRAKEKTLTGRINKDTIIVRVIK